MILIDIAKKAASIGRQAALAVCLFLTYFVGFGLTWLAALVFDRRLLGWSGRGEEDTFWTSAEGYEPDRDDCSRES